jgi:hypothetical protein
VARCKSENDSPLFGMQLLSNYYGFNFSCSEEYTSMVVGRTSSQMYVLATPYLSGPLPANPPSYVHRDHRPVVGAPKDAVNRVAYHAVGRIRKISNL